VCAWNTCGDPALNQEHDLQLMRRIVETALSAMQTDVAGPTLFDPDVLSAKEVAHAS